VNGVLAGPSSVPGRIPTVHTEKHDDRGDKEFRQDSQATTSTQDQRSNEQPDAEDRRHRRREDVRRLLVVTPTVVVLGGYRYLDQP
jgi:hypothetical protein